MAVQFQKHFIQDLHQDIRVRQCGTIVFNADNESNAISVDLYEDGEPATVTGTVAGSVICPDGSTVAVENGTISGNTVSITLTGDCFAIEGQIGVGIQVISGDVKTTVFKALYTVVPFETDAIVDPGSRTTLKVGDLIDDIEAAVASIPADYSDLLAAVAPDYDDLTFPVAAGKFCWYDGDLYVANTAIATAETWTAAHWDSAVIGDKVAGILDTYVKKTDYASSTAWGVVKVGNGLEVNTNNLTRVKRATDSQIKSGMEGYNSIVPYNQDVSVFYGLAKAAGDSSQASSSNTVGNYTADAKAAIRTMLGAAANDVATVAETETYLGIE